MRLVSILFLALAALTSCAPRGETKNLDEVLQISKDRYEEAFRKSDLDSETQAVLKDVESHLGTMEEKAMKTTDRTAFLSTARAMDSSLRQLISNVGYTTRPAFSEILGQYDNLAFSEAERTRVAKVSEDGEPSQWKFSPATVKLLVSRTYTLLAQELETSQFKVQPAAGKA